MSDYSPPLRSIRFALDSFAGLPEIAALPKFGEATPDLVDSILGEAGRIAAGVLAPLNRAGDVHGAELTETGVRTTPGWPEAWAALIEGGWNRLAHPSEFGGMDLPQVLNLAVQEMWHSANMAFALCPMLTQGQPTQSWPARCAEVLRRWSRRPHGWAYACSSRPGGWECGRRAFLHHG